MLKIKKMRAAILVESKKPLTIDEVELPEKLSFGQVLVKVDYSGICGSQIGEIDAVKGSDKFLPHLLGHEGSGIVYQIGAGVKHVQPGDSVVMHWRKGIGIEAAPPVYLWNGNKLNAGYVTTFNEYAIVSENRLTKISKDFNMQLAPLLGCAVTTGFGVVSNNANLDPGESIVVFGAGGVGLSVIQAAALTSAYPIIAVDLYDNKLELAGSLGATHMINSRKKDPVAEIEAILGQKNSVDVTIDNTGNPKIIEKAYEITKPEGRTILVGVPSLNNKTTIYTLPLHFGKVLTGSHGGESNPSVDIPRLIKLYNLGKLRLEKLITDQFTLDDINLAITKMRNGEIAGRALIEM